MARTVASVKRKKARSVSRPKKKPAYSRIVYKTRQKVSPRTGLGTKQWCKMIYMERGISINPGALGSCAFYQFRLNSIFDPNFTGVGHQPMSHDQMAELFEQYVVTSVDYKVVFNNTNTANNYLVGVFVSDVSDTNPDPNTIIEQGEVDWGVVGINTGYNMKTFSGHVSLPKLMGKDQKVYENSDAYCAAFGANPTDVGYLSVWAADVDTGGDPGTIYVHVELVYNVCLKGTRLTTGS